jgi:nicotinate-nucleotide adenylyltransferase
MNIGILGGSFNPPHNGHSLIAKRLLKLNYFDEVWLMPCYQHPFNKNLFSPTQRLEMTKYLEKNNVRVSDHEIKDKTTSYTINTLRFLANKYPADKFSLIIGTDQVKDFTKWKEWKNIIDDFKLIIVPRNEFKKGESELKNIAKQVINPKNIVLINKKIFPPIYISSTLIRNKIKKNKSISNLVPKNIEKYIIRHGLYK